ncbi:MAG: tRNA uridine-5-carboxymethylaminomethyl(34) synthesis GTPase MnmE [Rickettsiales bacterium]|jgi:tRNA modification GTPase|nr:tRNA uridine-5-carboxymethylaminomethyl(34) synthesis GTPase MnmE [Rickettsiales bacterium]
MDTIYALSSGMGVSGVAVIRISGENLQNLFHKITGRKNPEPRHAYTSHLLDNAGDIIDRAIAIYFSAPNSFTGTDVIEFHTHGSAAVIKKLFDVLKENGARLANPGEFSRRAFDNEKMDLEMADGLVNLLSAQTEKQRQFALRAAIGHYSSALENWRSQMIKIAAFATAMTDYDETDLPQNIGETLTERTQNLANEIGAAITRGGVARGIHRGFNITLAGDTNVGKSSLFNALLGTSRAIVSNTHGTTRDVITADLDLDGYLVRVADTAGLRETENEIEKIGIEKTNDEIKNADLVLRVYDARGVPNALPQNKNEIIVINKSDLLNENYSRDAICVSAKTGDGIEDLFNEIRTRVGELTNGAESDIVVGTRALEHLQNALNELNAALKNKNNIELFGAHINYASNEIGKILGTIGASDVADAIFSKLCLGK